jgi:phosphate acetyltransferase
MKMDDIEIRGKFFNGIIKRSRKIKKTIAFSDGNDIRLIHALKYLSEINDSSYILIGSEKTILDNIKKEGIKDSMDFSIMDPQNSKRRDEIKEIIASAFKNRNKKIDSGLLEYNSLNTSYWAAILLKLKEADCAIGGSISSTADLLRAVINSLGLLPGKKILSGSAFVEVPDCQYGLDGVFCVTDPAIIPKPSEDQLFDMAVSSYETAKAVFTAEPIVAMLSYSTMGSADGEEVERIKKAVQRVRNQRPEINIETKTHFDAAIVPEVAQIKFPKSESAGHANVLVFPELNAANIGYKIIQRLAKAEVCGTVIEGAARPFNDLSRGCLAKDIITLTAMTLLQTEGMDNAAI